VLGPEPGDPNVGERYRLRHALAEPCHLRIPFIFLGDASLAFSEQPSRWKRWWMREGGGYEIAPMAGKSVRDRPSKTKPLLSVKQKW